MPNSERASPGATTGGMQVVIITGLSGSGKSTAIHVLEDLGFYCIDNLPVTLIPRFLELCEHSKEQISRVALGIDLRERVSLHEYPTVLAELHRSGQRVDILYFEANDDVLMRRFSETRRPHPTAGEGGVLQGIWIERERLTGLRERATQVIDTSGLTVHDLRLKLRQLLDRRAHPRTSLFVTVESFGYKYGIPTDADIILDVRFLPNPFFVDELRAKSGLEAEVAAFVLQRSESERFLSQISSLLESTMPLYIREGKSYLTLAIGCTGGRHRSVVIAEELNRRFTNWGYTAHVRHRDLQR
jgi:RNase adapter protein RapZ